MKSLFARRDAVFTGRVQGKVRTAVLKGDAGAGDHQSGSEVPVVALDVGYHVSVLVRGAQIDRAASVRFARFCGNRPFPDEPGSFGCVLLRKQLLHGNTHEIRIGDVPVAVGIGQLDRLHLLVERICRTEFTFFQPEVFQDIHGHQHDDAISVGRDLPGCMAFIFHVDRFHPAAAVILQVAFTDESACFTGKGIDPLRQFSPVKCLCAGFGNQAQCLCVVRRIPYLSGFRRPAFGHKDPEQLPEAVAVGLDPGIQDLFVEPVELLFPQFADHRGEGIAVQGIADGCLEGIGQGQHAEATRHFSPGGGSAGNHHGVPSGNRHFGISHIPDLLGVDAHGRFSAGIESIEFFLFFDPYQGKCVASDAVGRGFHHGHARCGRYGGVDGVSASFQNIKSGTRRQRLGRADHSILGIGHTSSGWKGVILHILIHRALLYCLKKSSSQDRKDPP